MKQLFETENTGSNKKGLEESLERVINVLVPELTQIKYGIAFQKTNVLGTGVLFQLYNINNPDKHIFIIPWVRPEIVTVRQIPKVLADYPRLNVSSVFKEEQDKIKLMMQLAKQFDLYFLVTLPRYLKPSLYWLDKYENIDEDSWKLTYRTDPANLNRIHLPSYKKYEFIPLLSLKQKLNKIFKI